MKINLIGKRFGKLVVVEKTGRSDRYRRAIWKCKCDCGNFVEAVTAVLKCGDIKSCGCLRHVNLEGQRFGKLVALEKSNRKSKSGHAIYRCKCDCGNITYVEGANLKSGNTKGCMLCKFDNGQDLSGMRFGKLVVLELCKTRSKSRCKQWLCKCDCGNEKIVTSNNLTSGNVKSCGCLANFNLEGKRFGRLVVISKTSKTNKNGNLLWKCKCDCGKFKNITTHRLVGGKVKSCGCLHDEVIGKIKMQQARCINNIMNGRINANNRTGKTGVSFDTRTSRYISCITLNHKRYYLGSFERLEDAIAMRKKAEEDLFIPFLEKWKNNDFPEDADKILKERIKSLRNSIIF